MKLFLGCVLLAAALAAPATAQTPAPSPDTLKAAQELAAMMSGDTIGQMSAALTAQIWPNIEQQLGPRVDAATLTELKGQFEQSLSGFTTEVMRDSPAVYVRLFSAVVLCALL